MDDEASDNNDWLCDDFEEDDDDCDNGNDERDKEKFKSSREVVKYSPERNDGNSHIPKEEEERLPFDPSQDVVDRHKQDEKHKDDMKEKKDDSDGSVHQFRPPVDTAFHQTLAITNSSRITGVSDQSNKNLDNLSSGISCLESESLQQQSPSIENSHHCIGVNIRYSPTSELLLDESLNGSTTPDKTVPGQGKDVTVVQTQSQIQAHKIEEMTEHHSRSFVQIPFEGTVERRFSNSILQPGAQSCHPHNSGENSSYSGDTTIKVFGNKSVHINKGSGGFDPLKPIQEQCQLRLKRDLNPKLIVKTEKIKECEKTLKTWGLLLLTGGPGEGKTTAGLYLLKLMSDSGFNPLILTDPQQWDHISCSNKQNRYVILIDDAFGSTNLVEDLKIRWEHKFPLILPLIEAGTVCIIFSFKTNIYLRCVSQLRTFELFRRSKTVKLSTDNLSEKERLAMLDFHLKLFSKKACVSDEEKKKIIKCRDLVSFPLCCYLFTSTLRDEHGCIFFHRSLKYISEVIRSMRQNDPESFFVLLLVMFYENLLPRTVFDVFAQSSKDQEIIAKLSQVCTVRPSLGSLLNSAKSLCQTFLIFGTQNNCFSFMHNSIQDAVFLEFCKDHLSKGLEMCSMQTLLEYVTTDQRSCQEVTVIVFESQFEGLASRLVKEILSPSASLIFTHQAFKDLSFVRYFFLFLNAEERNELSVYNREIQSCGVHQYLTDTTITFLMNKCLNEPTVQHLFHSHYVNVLSIESIPACFVLNGADRIAIHLLKCMQQNEELFSCHANMALACSLYMNNRELAIELTELGAEITFDCFKAVCIAPSVNENLVELAAGILSEEHADSLWNLLTLSLEKGNCECINQIILFMARSGRCLQLQQFCKCLLITCHNTKPSWISVPLEQRKFVEIFDFLQSHEADCSSDLYVLLAAGCHDVNILKNIVKCGGNVHCRNETGQSPLHLAALYSSGDTVMYLLEQDVDKHARDNDGYTPLHRAAQSSTESYDKVVLLADENAQLMLNSGESVLDISIRKGDIETVEYLCNQFSDRGQLGDPLFVAVSELAQTLSSRERCPENVFQRKWTENRYHIVQMLIKAGFSMPDVNDIMLSSLNVLAERGKKDIFDAIIGAFDMTKCDVNTLFYLIKTAIHSSQSLCYDQLNCLMQSRLIVKDTESKTLLHYACQRRDTDVVEYLVKIEYQLNVTDDIDKTPLHYAVECEHVDIAMIECLIKGGATVNVKDRYGKTPLYLACERCDIAIVECLIEGGAKVNVKNMFDRTPFLNACQHGDTAMVECLIKGGAEVNVIGQYGTNPLHSACKRGDVAMVECLTLAGAEVNVKDGYEGHSLHYACKQGDTVMVECLTLAGAEVNVKDRHGETPLHYACQHGNTAMVECLIQAGAEVNVKDKRGETPLHNVCKHGNTAMVECLIQAGAEVNVKDRHEDTPLHYACQHGNTAMVECLIPAGAEVNVKDWCRKTPLHYACKHGNTAMVECLIPAGAEMNVKDMHEDTPLHYACKHGNTAMVECLIKGVAEVNVKDWYGETPLHKVCKHGESFMVEFPIKEGATVNEKDWYWETPLYSLNGRDDIAIVECLIEGGAEVNLKDQYGNTPLLEACKHGDTAMVECLIQAGAEVNVVSQNGNTPLHNACTFGDTAMVECLIKAGSVVNVMDWNENTPLHYACKHGESIMVECLIKGGAIVNVKDGYGETPLYSPNERDDTDIVECLIEGGAEVNVQDKHGNTPLHEACKHGNTAMVECLMKRGAELNVKNSDGKTPLQYVFKQRNNDTVQCLVRSDVV